MVAMNYLKLVRGLTTIMAMKVWTEIVKISLTVTDIDENMFTAGDHLNQSED